MERVKLCHFEIAICRLQLGKCYAMFLLSSIKMFTNTHPQFMPLQLAQAKNGIKHWQAITIVVANEVNQHAPKGPKFFFLLGEESRCWIFSFPQCVPTKFPIAPHFIPYPLPQVLLLVTYIRNPKDKITTYLFWECPKLYYYYFVMSQ